VRAVGRQLCHAIAAKDLHPIASELGREVGRVPLRHRGLGLRKGLARIHAQGRLHVQGACILDLGRALGQLELPVLELRNLLAKCLTRLQSLTLWSKVACAMPTPLAAMPMRP